jgi:hypothetical protein
MDCDISLTLKTSGGGTGTFSWNIGFPADMADEANSSFTLEPYGGGTSYTIPYAELNAGSLSLPAGYYFMELKLGNSDSFVYRAEIVHIGIGITTLAEYSFADGDFISSATVYRQADNEFYPTLKAAIDAATSGTASAPDIIYLLTDIDSAALLGNGNSGITINGKYIKLFPADGDKTIKRWSGNTGSLFTVSSGSLTLEGTTVSGVTEDLVVDGGAVWSGGGTPAGGATNSGLTASAALITVSGGTLNLEDGAALRNNNRSDTSVGGGVYVNGGAFTMSGGTISGNTAVRGGGVGLDSGTFTMSGGTISGNSAISSGWGGGLYSKGTVILEGGAIRDNLSNDSGGGIFTESSHSLTIKTGVIISGNTAASGGGIKSVGAIIMEGGTISGNTTTGNTAGKGVNVEGTFSMSGSALVAADNDVYLSSGKTITISGNLTPTANPNNPVGNTYSARITPSGYTEETQVLGGTTDLISANYNKFAVTQPTGGGLTWAVGSVGKLVNDAVAMRGTVGYPTLAAAIAASTGTSAAAQDTITIIQNINIAATAVSATQTETAISLATGKHVKLTVPSTASYTIKRTANGFGSLFTVPTGSSLTLAGNGTTRTLTIDGGAVWTGGSPSNDPGHGATNTGTGALSATSALVTVDGGNFVMNTGAVLRNNEVKVDTAGNTNNSGGVYVPSGTFTMSGGTISGNAAAYSSSGSYNFNGGGVCASGGTFTMSGGTISGNLVTNDGGGVYVSGVTFTMSGGEISGNRSKYNGGGVVVMPSGTLNMSAGNISGNSADANGDGVYVFGAFNMSGSALIAADNDVYLSNGKMITITAALTNTSTVATITPQTYTAGTTQVLTDGGSYLTANHYKFAVTQPAGTLTWAVGSDGYLKNDAVAKRETVIDSVSHIVGYTTLANAILASTGTSATAQDTITIIQNINIAATAVPATQTETAISIPTGKHVKLTVPPNVPHTIKRTESGLGSLFTVSGGSLTLGGNGSGNMVIDGGAVWTGGTPTNDPGHGASNDTTNGGKTATAVLVDVASSGTFTMNTGSVLQNNAKGGLNIGSSGIAILNGGTITANHSGSTNGGGISHASTGTLTFGSDPFVISNNRTTGEGGGIKAERALTLPANLTISGNRAETGGGLSTYGSYATVTMNGATISGNHATSTSQGGGGVALLTSILIMNSGTISDNSTAGQGGGVMVGYSPWTGTFTMNSGTISGNSATGNGGGVSVNNIFTMTGGTIYGNTASNYGGGVNVGSSSSYTFTMSGGTIYGNSAGANSNTATVSGASLYKGTSATAKYGNGDAISSPSDETLTGQ